MAEIINMPRLSDTMEEGVVAKWLKKVGDKVEEGDILAEIETDKATMEFESFSEGILLYIGLEEGETAPVDSLLAIIGEKGEDISALLEGGKKPDDKENKEDSEDKEVQKSGDEVKDSESVSEDENSDEDGEIPEGVQVINMPRLSDTMEEGTVAKWIKHEGDEVEEGDILAEIETDKATMEFESFYNGTLLKIGIQEGESAKVDTLLAIIGPKGTDISKIGAKSGASKESPVLDKKSSEEKPKEVEISEESKASKTHSDKRIFASPLAKKMAEDKGIKLADVKGSGENGRIVKKDVESFKPSEKAKSAGVSEEVKAEAKVVQAYVAAGEE